MKEGVFAPYLAVRIEVVPGQAAEEEGSYDEEGHRAHLEDEEDVDDDTDDLGAWIEGRLVFWAVMADVALAHEY